MNISKLAVVALLAFCSQIAWSAEVQKDVGGSTSAVIDFIRGAAKITAMAKTNGDDPVKFLVLGVNSSGIIVVIAIAVGGDHGAPFKPPPEAIAVAHVHNKRMSAKPEAADYVDIRVLGLPVFVISSDGGDIWEIAILSGINKYRAVLASGVGEWVDF